MTTGESKQHGIFVSPETPSPEPTCWTFFQWMGTECEPWTSELEITSAMFYTVVDILVERHISRQVFGFPSWEALQSAIELEVTSRSRSMRKKRKFLKRLRTVSKLLAADNEAFLNNDLREDNAKFTTYPESMRKWIFSTEVNDDVRKVCRKGSGLTLNPLALAVLMDEAGLTDWDPTLPQEISEGFDSAGPSVVSRFYRLRPDLAHVDFTSLGYSPVDNSLDLLRMEKSQPYADEELLKTVEEGIEKDIALGRYRRISRKVALTQLELGGILTRCFGVRQGTPEQPKFREIWDERRRNRMSCIVSQLTLPGTRHLQKMMATYRSGTPPKVETFQSRRSVFREMELTRAAYDTWCSQQHPDQLPQCRRDAAQNIAQAIATLEARESIDPERAFITRQIGLRVVDYKKAYHMLPVQAGGNIGTYWSQASQDFEYLQILCCTMGNVLSVVNWCRLAEMVAGIVVRAGAPCSIYIDDGVVFGRDEGCATVNELIYLEVSQAIGLDISGKAEARQSSEDGPLKILGLIWSFDGDWVLSLPPASVNNTLQTAILLRDAARDRDFGRLDRTSLQKVLGRCQWYSDVVFLQIHKSLHWFEYWWNLTLKVRFFLRQLVNALDLVIDALEELAQNPISLRLDESLFTHSHPWIMSDASLENGEARLGAFVIDRSGQVHYFTFALRAEAGCSIGYYETLAALWAVKVFKAVISGSRPCMYVDNSEAVFATLRGSCRNNKTRQLAAEFERVCRSQKTRPHLEWVPSRWNLSDMLTRSSLFVHFLRMFPNAVRVDVGHLLGEDMTPIFNDCV